MGQSVGESFSNSAVSNFAVVTMPTKDFTDVTLASEDSDDYDDQDDHVDHNKGQVARRTMQTLVDQN